MSAMVDVERRMHAGISPACKHQMLQQAEVWCFNGGDGVEDSGASYSGEIQSGVPYIDTKQT